MSDPMLPIEFADLESFATKWCLATEAERYCERLASSMPEMQRFYDIGIPRLREAMKYLDQFPLSDLDDQQTNLLQLMYSVIMVSLPVEVWSQPQVIDAGSTFFDRCVEPTP